MELYQPPELRPKSRGFLFQSLGLTQARGATWTSEHAGGRHLVAAGRAIEPVAAVLALRVRQPLLFLALGTLAIHLAMADVFFKDQAAFCADLGIPAMIRGLASRRRADIDSMTIVTPVLAARHLFTYRALFHQGTSSRFLPSRNLTLTR